MTATMTSHHRHSERTTRMVNNVSLPRASHNNTHGSQYNSADLETNYSDDSSVFSGLVDQESLLPTNDGQQAAQHTGSRSSESLEHPYPEQHYPQQSFPQILPSPKGISRKSTTGDNGSKSKSIGQSKSMGSSFEGSQDSVVTERSQRSILREMSPMVDSDTLFGQSTTASFLDKSHSNSATLQSGDPSADFSASRSASGAQYGSSSIDQCESGAQSSYPSVGRSSSVPSSRSSLSERGYDNDDPSLFPDEDVNTQMSWASAQHLPRPKGTVKLVSSVTFADQDLYQQQKQQQSHRLPDHQTRQVPEARQPVDEMQSDDSSSRMVELLSDFEKQMDKNIKSIQDDDHQGDILSELQEVVPRRAKSEDGPPILTPHKARKLQRILHKAREEVEVLRDNNEQYKSEIEQMEEEHKSELKLIDDRAKQKIAELKSMYQQEMESLTREKDAALIEAGRQAARYAESGKKQVASMKKQLEKLKATATATIREKVTEAASKVMAKKDMEITARLGALRKSYESELEKVRKECDDRLRTEVEAAVSSVAQRVRLNQDVLIDEQREQIENLKKERRAVTVILDCVQSNFEKHYPEELKLYVKKSQDFAGCARRLLDVEVSADHATERLLRDVVETFAFLLETTEKKVSAEIDIHETEPQKKERAEDFAQLRKELVLRHRAEIEHMRKEKGEALDKVKGLEENFKNLGREKRFLEEKHRKMVESHRLELEKIRTEKDAFANIERSRTDLALAMVIGERKLIRTKDKECHLSEQSETSEKARPPFELSYSESLSKSRKLDTGFDTVTANAATAKVGAAIGFGDSGSLPIRCFSEHSRTTHGEYGSDSSRTAWDSPSVRKARTFQIRNPQLSPRHSSPRSRTNVFVEPVGSEAGMTKNGNAVKALEGPVASDATFSTRRAIDPVENADKVMSSTTDNLRKSVDPSPQFNNSNESNHSIRSKTTILSNLKNQSKKTNDSGCNTGKGIPDLEDKLDPSGEEPTKSDIEEQYQDAVSRRKNFAILRSFKANSETPVKNPASHGKEPEGKADVTNIMTRSLRRARSLRTYFNSGKVDDTTRSSRASLDGSISSLQTLTGEGTTQDDVTIDESACFLDGEDSRQNTIDARQSTKFVNANLAMSQEVGAVDVSGSLHKSEKRTINTVGMFAQAKQDKIRGDEVVPSDKRNDHESQCNTSVGDSMSGEATSNASESDTIHKKISEESRMISHEDTNHEEECRSPFKDACSNLNLKKPLIQDSHNEAIKFSDRPKTKSSHHNVHRINGKKQGPFTENGVVSIFPTRNLSEDSDEENAVPATVSVPSPTKKNQGSINGHTLLCKPLSVSHSRTSHPPGNTSSLSGVTSETMPSSEEDAGLSQAQMRKFPPLTDESDEDSVVGEAQDKYETCDSSKFEAGMIINRGQEADYAIPTVVSSNVHESPIMPMDSPDNRRKPIVVQGQHIYRPPGLATFRPSRQSREDTTRRIGQDPSDAASAAGSSVSTATTAITAHTMKSSVIRAPKGSGVYLSRKSLPSSTSSLPSTNSHAPGSTRFAALKARVRVRRSDMGLSST